MKINEYFKKIQERVVEDYAIANKARAIGIDPVANVEIPIATSLAEKAVGLISTLYPQIADEKIVKRILALEKEHGSLEPAVALTIAEEIAKEKFCKFKNLKEAIEAGARVAIAYLTLGVVSSSIEGFVSLGIEKTRDGKEYFAPYYSGPIRSAGGTEAAFSLVIIDYLREVFGYARYDPTEEEIKRGVHESYLYHERINNLQYLPTEKEIESLLRHVPIQVSGDPSETLEVFSYKDLKRIPTNFIRSGFCLVLNEGLAQKAPKILKRIKKLKEKGFKLSGWSWLDEFVKFQSSIKESKKVGSDASAVYIKDLVAGRPVFGHPSFSGAFRLRYGRCRNTGYSTLGIHPATMAVCGNFIAIGTQLKIEKPTKGCTVASCTTIDGPIVKLKKGDVKQLKTAEEASGLYKDVEEIIYLGDLLVPYGDYANRNHALDKPAYVEQYWFVEVKSKGGKSELFPSFENALEISEKYKVALHPSFTYFWREIKYEELLELLDWFARGEIRGEKLVLPFSPSEKERFIKAKRALEILGCEHAVGIENVIIDNRNTKSLLFNLGIEFSENLTLEQEVDNSILKVKESRKTKNSVLEIINDLCKFEIKDKAGTFAGARMGRPEKAKLRKLTGSPHVLFPVGREGGRLRSFQAALEVGRVIGDFPDYFCGKCNADRIYPRCEECGETCIKIKYCPKCDKNYEGKCLEHDMGLEYKEKKIDIKDYFDKARKQVGLTNDEVTLVKGVRGTSSEDHSCENLAKGILRAKFNLHVNKDGTIRYDMSEMPLTHFKPKEIRTSVEKLKELGYEKDIYGKDLENEEQILEIFPHDIILPASPESQDEKADDVFLRITKFVDEELRKIYGVPGMFNAEKKEDIIGCLLGCMAPHNCAAVVGRLIGFSKTQALLASPYMHAAMRRDCVHPETKLLFFNKDEMHYPEIGEFIEGLIKKGCKTKVIDGVGTLRVEPDNNYYSYGANPENKSMEKRKIKYFIKGPVDKKWIKVTTATNREIKMTMNHDFMYLEGNEIKFKKAREIEEGDRLLVLDYFNFPKKNIEKIDLIKSFIEKLPIEIKHKIRVVGREDFFIDIAKDKKVREKLEIEHVADWAKAVPLDDIELLIKMGYEIPENVKVKYWFSNKVFERAITLDKEFWRILGNFTAEGHYRENKTTRQVCFRICNKELREELLKNIEKCFGLKGIVEEESKITIAHSIIYYLFKYVLETGAGAKSKKVPKLVYSLDDEKVLEYLNGFIDGDGSVVPERRAIVLYSTSRKLLDEIALLLTRFGVIGRYQRIKERLPGRTLIERYKELKLEPRSFGLFHLVFNGVDCMNLASLLKLHHRGKLDKIKELLEFQVETRLLKLNKKYIPLYSFGDCFIDYVKKVEIVNDEKNSYCVEVEWKRKEERSVIWGEQIINTRCDGDEAAVMLLMDMLLNFSRKYLPAHRGGTQDAPLVLNARMKAGEVDDMIFDLDVSKEIPLELYKAAEEEKSPYEIKMEQVRGRLGSEREFSEVWFSYDTEDINLGPSCSSYKTLPTMQEKVNAQMTLCKKIRAVDVNDVARLIIERHFIRDIRGNLRKFSQQGFRCVACNAKFRRPPLIGKCTSCGGKIIFTISEGSIIKYMQSALDLARDYKVSPYLLESLELTEMYIQSIFGKEKEKQEALEKWF